MRHDPTKDANKKTDEVLDQLRRTLDADIARTLDLFRSWDTNNTGRISLVELRRVLHELGDATTGVHVDTFFETLDQDESGLVEYRELHKALRRKPATSRSTSCMPPPTSGGAPAPAMAPAAAIDTRRPSTEDPQPPVKEPRPQPEANTEASVSKGRASAIACVVATAILLLTVSLLLVIASRPQPINSPSPSMPPLPPLPLPPSNPPGAPLQPQPPPPPRPLPPLLPLTLRPKPVESNELIAGTTTTVTLLAVGAALSLVVILRVVVARWTISRDLARDRVGLRGAEAWAEGANSKRDDVEKIQAV